MPELNASMCAVVLVNYKNAGETLACLESLLGLNTPPAYILVVDNASGPASLNELRAGWSTLCAGRGLPAPEIVETAESSPPRFGVLPQEENLGFAGGNNAALAVLLRADCLGFWLLNNDTRVDPAALDRLCATCNAAPNAGICGSTILYASSPENLQCAAGGRLCRLTGRTDFILGGARKESALLADPATCEAKLDWVLGCSFFVKREVLEKVGLLPQEYFLYYEDVAFSRLAVKAGFSLHWSPESLVFHKEGGTTAAKGGGANSGLSRPPIMDYLAVRNRLYLMRTVYPWSLPVAIPGLAGVFLNRLRRGQADRLPLLLRAAANGLIGNMGRPAGFEQ